MPSLWQSGVDGQYEHPGVVLSDELFDSALRMISCSEPNPFHVQQELQPAEIQHHPTSHVHDGGGRAVFDMSSAHQGFPAAQYYGGEMNAGDNDNHDGDDGVGGGRVRGGGGGGGGGGSVAMKRPRVNVNQAEVQKRYRERKKLKMAELEKTVDDLRAKVQELEREKQQREMQNMQQQQTFKNKLMEQKLASLQSLQRLQQEQQMLTQTQTQTQKGRGDKNVSGNPGTPPSDADADDMLVLKRASGGKADSYGVAASPDPGSSSDDGGKRSEASRDDHYLIAAGEAAVAVAASAAAAAAMHDEAETNVHQRRLGSVLNRDFTVITGAPGGTVGLPVPPPTAEINTKDVANILAAAPSKFEDGGSDDDCAMQVLMASLEIGVTIKKEEEAAAEAAEEEEKEEEEEKKRRFKSYVEAELWFGGVQDMYDLNVEKIRMMLNVGASDGDLRVAISDLNCIVNDARNSHPDLALVTTAQASIQSMTDRGIPIMDCCPTSCLLMSKSVVDATLMQSDWPAVVEKIEQNVPPMDIDLVIEWSDGYFAKLMDVYNNRGSLLTRFKEAQLPPGASANEDNIYGVSTSELIARKGVAAEMSRALLLNMQQELSLHAEGCRELFTEKLSPRTAAAIIVHSQPHVPDPLSMAFEFKKRREARSGDKV